MSSRLLLFALACVNAVRCSVGTALLDNLSQRLRPHSSPAGEAPNTVVSGGRIVGDWALDTVDGRVARFLGIPFAVSTEGPHRWRPPEPAASWAPGTLNATHWGPACAQGQPSSDPDVPADQSEDCLTVNVFTPALGRPRGSPPLPVLLFFHGCVHALVSPDTEASVSRVSLGADPQALRGANHTLLVLTPVSLQRRLCRGFQPRAVGPV
jgi:Carboxylesterase family